MRIAVQQLAGGRPTRRGQHKNWMGRFWGKLSAGEGRSPISSEMPFWSIGCEMRECKCRLLAYLVHRSKD